MANDIKITRRQLIASGLAIGASTVLGSKLAFAAKEDIFIPFSNKSLDYYFFVIEEEAARRAIEANKWTFQATNANFSNTTQLEHWQSLMLKNPSAIISDPIDSQAIISAIRRYNQKKIPVAIIDTPADGGDVAITISFDNYLGGQMAAEEIIKRLEERHGSAKGKVLNCYGDLSSTAWRLRKEGFDEVMGRHPDIELLSRPTEGQLEQMLSVTRSTLSEHPDLDAVHAPSDSPANGIATALKQRDRWTKVGEEGHVIFVTIDGEPNALNWIREGYMDACVSQDPVAYGEIAVEMLQKYSLQGEAVPLGEYENKKYFWEIGDIIDGKTGPTLVIPPFVINSENASDERHWGHVAEKVWGIPYA